MGRPSSAQSVFDALNTAQNDLSQLSQALQDPNSSAVTINTDFCNAYSVFQTTQFFITNTLGAPSNNTPTTPVQTKPISASLAQPGTSSPVQTKPIPASLLQLNTSTPSGASPPPVHLSARDETNPTHIGFNLTAPGAPQPLNLTLLGSAYQTSLAAAESLIAALNAIAPGATPSQQAKDAYTQLRNAITAYGQAANPAKGSCGKVEIFPPADAKGAIGFVQRIEAGVQNAYADTVVANGGGHDDFCEIAADLVGVNAYVTRAGPAIKA